MKILYITTFYDKQGGSEILFRETVEYFSKYNETDVISIMPSAKVTSPNKTYNINANYTISLILKKAEQGNYDFIHIFLGHSILLKISIELKKKGIKVLFHVIDPWFTFPYFKFKLDPLIDKDFFPIREKLPKSREFEAFSQLSSIEHEMEIVGKNISINKFADIVVCCSSDVREYFLKYHSPISRNVKIVPLYNRLGKFDPQTIKRNTINNVAYIGRISDSWKDFLILLKAINNKNFTLYVFDRSRNSQRYLNAYCKYIGFEKSKIKLINYSSDITKTETLSDIPIVVIPSIAEGFSFVMVESMSLGKIVVAGTRFGGPKDIIKNKVNGFMFKPGEYKSLSKTLDKITKQKISDNIKISKNAIFTSSIYTKDKYLNNLSKIYNKLYKKTDFLN